jgi:hypothetical protein
LVTVSNLVIANLVALIASTGWLTKLTLPSSQAVRVRNAFLLRRGKPQDVDWTPATAPPHFNVERCRAPAAIEAAVRSAGVQQAGGDWSQACALVTMLLQHWRSDGPIQSDLTSTYNGIVSGSGYCADYVRVYLAAASAIGLFCRQWAFSFDGFGGHGHTFVEIYDRQRAKWTFLDVHNNVYAVRAGTEELLGGMELRTALLESSPIEFRPAGPGRLGFTNFDKLLAYFRRGAGQWYLWWGNDVITRDATGFSGLLSLLSGRVAHRLTSAFHLPRLVVIATDENEHEIRRMERLRKQVQAVLILVAGLTVLFGLQLWRGVL